jgi:hypothetical protein
VNDQGRVCLARAKVIKSIPDVSATNATSYQLECSVEVTSIDTSSSTSRSWRIFEATYPDSEAADLVSNRLGYDVGPVLRQEKLLPKVGIAMPLLHQPTAAHSGRLYTYLPLPLSTGFPCHVHGLFALTPDRQHLRNGEETGVVEGVDRSV